MNECAFCNKSIRKTQKRKEVTDSENLAEGEYRNSNQDKYSVHEINSVGNYAHDSCKPNIRNWHISSCNMVWDGRRKCSCGCNKVIHVRNKDEEFLEAIKSFEQIHKKYLEKDGSLNQDGVDYLHDAEVNWADDIKWNDHIKFHMQPRLSDFWFGNGGGEETMNDIEYRKQWRTLHPKLAKEYGVE